MARTICLLDQRWTWKDWLEANQKGRPIMTLDPAVLPGRITCQKGGKITGWRFAGSTEPTRNPLTVLGASVQLARSAGDDWVAFLFPPTENPVTHELALEVAQCLHPTEILAPRGSGLADHPWPIGATEVNLEPGFPPVVREAQRRAQWLDLIHSCQEHEIVLGEVSIMGGRLGQGKVAPMAPHDGMAWIYGGVLHWINDKQPHPHDVSKMGSDHHAKRVNFASVESYEGLLIALADQDGTDLGVGFIRGIDLHNGSIHIQSTLGSSARILRLGTTRVDKVGREIEEVKPWTV